MMESSEEKKRIFYMVVLLLTLITMIIGATLAYFSLVASQKEDGTVLYTGKLEINYIDGVYIKNPELEPIPTPSYDTYEKVYRNSFAVSSSGTLEQTITVEMEVTTNEFSPNAMKYIIFNEDGKKLTSGTIPKEGKINLASDMYLEATGTAKYTLIIWLAKTENNQNREMGKRISGKINIHSKQMWY